MTKNGTMSQIVKPILVLTVICLVISAALAFTNSVTAPIIEKAALEAAETARREVLPEADEFEKVAVSGLPETVTAVYRAENGAGYVFMLTSDGYGGAKSLELICGIGADGLITETRVLSHKETAGLGSKVTEEAFRGQFAGKDASLEGVDIITGASWSSRYYIGAVEDAFAAYELVKEAS